MREIKFRAFEKKVFKTMCYGEIGDNVFFGFKYPDGKQRVWLRGEWGDPDFAIMQYTELKDKNGVEIYDGDVILNKTATEPENHGWVVFWDKYKWALRLNDQQYQYVFDFDENFDMNLFEVIGNIYENPELINK